MITDAVIGAVFALVETLVGWLPDMPDQATGARGRPAIALAMNLVYTADYLLPVTEILGFLSTVGAVVFGGFVVWRLIRFLWIGGG